MKRVLIVFSVLVGFLAFGQTMEGGGGHTLLVCQNGLVFGVGANYMGEVGDSTTDTVYAYKEVVQIDSVTSVSAGFWHSLALRADGTVWAWGGNDGGQLVNGGSANSLIPLKIDSITNVWKVSAGAYHSLFLREDSTVWGGGGNSFGELGFTSPPYVFFDVVKINGLTQIIEVSAGNDYSVALKDDGTVWTFGRNSIGQLGTGNLTNYSTPQKVQGLNGIVGIMAGPASVYAWDSNGLLWSWGTNVNGELGAGLPMGIGAYSPYPVQVQIDSVSKVVVEGAHAMALRFDGSVWGWGDNGVGQVGDGTTSKRNFPVQAIGLGSAVDIAATPGTGTAINQAGIIYTWGSGPNVANGTGNQKLTPSPITPIACNPVVSLYEQKGQKTSLKVYPNPTNGFLSLEGDAGSTIESVEVYNTTGVPVMKVVKPRSRIDISALPKGIYFIQCEVDGEIVVKKILKE